MVVGWSVDERCCHVARTEQNWWWRLNDALFKNGLNWLITYIFCIHYSISHICANTGPIGMKIILDRWTLNCHGGSPEIWSKSSSCLWIWSSLKIQHRHTQLVQKWVASQRRLAVLSGCNECNFKQKRMVPASRTLNTQMAQITYASPQQTVWSRARRVKVTLNGKMDEKKKTSTATEMTATIWEEESFLQFYSSLTINYCHWLLTPT